MAVDPASTELILAEAPAELDLRGLERLERVRVGGGGLARLRLGRHPRLRSLEVAHHALTELELGELPALTLLDVGFNRLARLDLRGLPALSTLWCQGNGLTELRLPPGAPLTRLAMGKNRLGGFDPRGYPGLTMLLVDALGLTALPLAHPALEHLACEGNQLARLELGGAPALRVLTAGDNPLATVDLRSLARLREVALPAQTEVLCSTLQRHALAGLRARFGLPAGTKVLAKMDPYELHLFADRYNWDDGLAKLFDVIRHPRCDLATALLVYWRGEPEELAGWRTAKEAPREERKAVELLRELEERVARGAYATRLVPFDARDVNGVDLASGDSRIPEAMRVAVVPEAEPPAGPPPRAKAGKPATKPKVEVKVARSGTKTARRRSSR